MQGGYLDKAQKYTDKALIQIEKLRSKFFLIQTDWLYRRVVPKHSYLCSSFGPATDTQHVSLITVGADYYVQISDGK